VANSSKIIALTIDRIPLLRTPVFTSCNERTLHAGKIMSSLAGGAGHSARYRWVATVARAGDNLEVFGSQLSCEHMPAAIRLQVQAAWREANVLFRPERRASKLPCWRAPRASLRWARRHSLVKTVTARRSRRDAKPQPSADGPYGPPGLGRFATSRVTGYES
jgi:hypothetical protein